MAAESELPELISSIKSLAEGLAADRAKKTAEEDTKNSTKTLATNLAKNSVAVLGLSQGLTSMKGFFSQAARDNTKVVGQLAKFTTASTTTSKQLLASLNTGYTTMQEGLATQGELISMGMADMSKGNKESFIAMKALGVNLAGVTSITRFNQEALGISADASTELSKSLIETAIKNGTSMEALVSAVESMRGALIKTSVELGPEMSMKVQNVVARMTQNNSDLAGAAANFVTSLVSGEEGFFKAAKLGIMFNRGDSEDQLVAKIEEAARRMNQMSAGAQGGVAFQRFEDAFGISRENFMVAKKLGTDIEQMRRADVKNQAEQLKQLDVSRQIEVNSMMLQSKGVDFMQGIAAATAPLQMFVPAALLALGTIASMTTIMASSEAFGGVGKISTLLKSKTGFGARLVGAGALLPTLKDIVDSGREGATGADVGGAVGGVVGGALGLFGGPIGVAIGASLGNTLGSFIGQADRFNKDSLSNEKETNRLLKEMHGIEGKTQKDTEEIRQIQQDQERRARTLSNPQISILTTINDTLVRNLAVLERTAGQTRRQTELIEDSKFDNATMKAPMLSRAIGAN
jgi:hypothetical protein